MNKRMNHFMLVVSVITAASSYAQTTDPAPYCNGGYDDGFMPVEHYISKVSIGTLDNNSGTTQSAAPHYTYYNNLSAPELTKGDNYELSVAHNGGASIHYVAAFIDFNNNQQFDLPEECVLHQSIHDQVNNPSVATITIPATATEGVTRMRVMVYEDDEFTWVEDAPKALPCTDFSDGSFDWGETEDYNIRITSGATARIEGVTETAQYTVSPNPVKGYINVNEAWKGATVSIVDLSGRQLAEYVNISTERIDVSHLKPGTVILKVTSGKGIFSQKIMID